MQKMLSEVGRLRRRNGVAQTVEAAFIIPFTVFCIVAVILVVFWMYNRARLRRAMDMAVYQMVTNIDMGGSIEEEEARRILEGQLKGFVGAKVLDREVDVDGDSGRIRVSLALKGLDKRSISSLVGGIARLEEEGELAYQDRSWLLRIRTEAEDLLDWEDEI